MEDHLRNKYRLDQEWQALCSYEAEPSTSVFVASKVRQNFKTFYVMSFHKLSLYVFAC